MPSSLTCPEDAELLAVAAGEEPSETLQAHLNDCARCRERLGHVRSELSLLRESPPSAPLAASTARVPRGPAAASGRAGGGDGSAGCHETRSSAGAASDVATNLGFGLDSDGARDPDLPAAIGKYFVIGRFPRTGQAEVFRVVHPGLGKDLVLKLALEPVESDGRSEIIEEGKILAGLDHPFLVRIYDLDFDEDRPYLVMEYIRGRSLDQKAADGRMRPRLAADLLAKVAGAAEYAHRHGIVHRDIKPQNILVDESDQPRLIDFGMASLRHAYADDPGRPGGTFAYMAPEQARVESPEEQQKVGPRSDVFALGAVLYHLLTGGAPFQGANWRESMSRARRCDFDRAALGDAGVPRALRRICLRAMANDPAERYPSAEGFEKALRR